MLVLIVVVVVTHICSPVKISSNVEKSREAEREREKWRK